MTIKRQGASDFRPWDIPDAFIPYDDQEPDPAIGPGARDRIGSKLRAMYGALAEEPLPRRFVELLQQLDASGRKDLS
jgi:hypothetical protein